MRGKESFPVGRYSPRIDFGCSLADVQTSAWVVLDVARGSGRSEEKGWTVERGGREREREEGSERGGKRYL